MQSALCLANCWEKKTGKCSNKKKIIIFIITIWFNTATNKGYLCIQQSQNWDACKYEADEQVRKIVWSG